MMKKSYCISICLLVSSVSVINCRQGKLGEIFRSPLESVGSWGGKFSINSPNFREFVEKFERSSYVQYSVLAHFKSLMVRDHEIIARDIAMDDGEGPH